MSDLSPAPAARPPGWLQLSLRDVIYLVFIAALALGWWTGARRTLVTERDFVPQEYGPCVLKADFGPEFRFDALEIRDGYAFGQDGDEVRVLPLGNASYRILPVVERVAPRTPTKAANPPATKPEVTP